MKYKYSIIEQESSTVNSLQNYFKKHTEFACIGASSSYDKSLDLILEHGPNLVFIDVDHVGENYATAFNFVSDMYKYLDELPYLIALSSSTAQAYNTIKNNFFDYLLKPVNEFELRKSLARLAKKPMESSNKLCIKSYKDYKFLDLEEILFIKADNNATDFFMLDGSTVSAFKSLKFYETVLPEYFTRIHNSYIINQNFVSRIHFGKSECTMKKSPHHIPFSRSYRKNVVVLEKTLSKKALLSLN